MPTSLFYQGPEDPFSGSITIEDREEATAAVHLVSEAYGWLSSYSNYRDVIHYAKEHLETRLEMLRQNVSSDYSDEHIIRSLNEEFSGLNSIPLPGSRNFTLIEKLREHHSAEAAAAAFLALSGGTQPSAYDPRSHIGLTAVSLTRLGVGADFTAATRASLRKIYDNFRQSALKADIASGVYNADMVRATKRRRRLERAILHRAKRRQSEARSEFEASQASATEERDALLLAFREQLKLKAPVEYWTDKASQHRVAAASYRRLAILGGPTAAVMLLIVLGVLAWVSLRVATAETSAATLLIFATMGVVSTTAVLWAARIVVRLFLSEHHLAIDAEERATMVSTYLALTADGAIDTTERHLVLSSLFRPTADGIVKDDAAPSFGPGSVLSGIAARP